IGVRGRYRLREAFEKLLDGTGLLLELDGKRYTLGQLGPGVQVSTFVERGTTTLPAIRVQAKVARTEPSYRADGVVTPLRGKAEAIEVPQSVTVITSDLIRDQAMQSMADLVRYVPGIGAAQGEGNRDTPVFRGASSTADFLVDGIRDDVQYYRDFYNIDRVEALRGPDAANGGHGGVGGGINRITKQPLWQTRRELSLQAGSWGERRATLDWNKALNDQVSTRWNAMTEASDGYRDHFQLKRSGINPVLGLKLPGRLQGSLGFEHFQDSRVADRGIPSYQGKPLETEPGAFFGNPDASTTWVRVNAVDLQFDLALAPGWNLHNRTRQARYNKFFQNVFPGAVRMNGGVMEVSLVGHNSKMTRHNTFSQTDLTVTVDQGPVRHELLAGIELGRQKGTNRRETAFFNGNPATTSIFVPVQSPVSFAPVGFRVSPTDPNSASEASVVGLYVQDRLRFSPSWTAVAGLRHDRLDIEVQDRQQSRTLSSRDRVWSPRAGLVYQPRLDLSAYVNYSLSFQPRAGEQLTSLTLDNQALEPERFTNREVGVKWLPQPELEMALALYRLDRQNVAVATPASVPVEFMLVDGQRTHGLELSLAGRVSAGWRMLGAYTWQRSEIQRSLSPAAQAGATVAHVPRHMLAVWNRWALTSQWATALGVQRRTSIFTSTDNTVRLPGYTRLDGAVFFSPRADVHLQLNVENLLDTRYYAFAHSNNNITPGAPRTLRLGLNLDF
ncbi:MAG: TonB-dependent siderophore receptor, partial [Rhizobacter sp.]